MLSTAFPVVAYPLSGSLPPATDSGMDDSVGYTVHLTGLRGHVNSGGVRCTFCLGGD